jgi:hypothetical protein
MCEKGEKGYFKTSNYGLGKAARCEEEKDEDEAILSLKNPAGKGKARHTSVQI